MKDKHGYEKGAYISEGQSVSMTYFSFHDE